MKKTLLFLAAMLVSAGTLHAQAPSWKYINEIKFPPADTGKVQPFLCSVDQNGRLWVISSKVTSATAHNAIFYADSTDTQFKKFIDFDNNGDSDTLLGNIGAIRGIANLNNDVFIMSTQPYPKTKPNTLSVAYYYKNRDTTQVEKFGSGIGGGAGYGTFMNGLAATKDTVLFSSNTAGATGPGPKVRSYNFTYGRTPPNHGSWITESPTDGATHTGGLDVIRDVALVPGGDYNNPETPFYTSRNSVSSTLTTGGVTVWSGGTQFVMGNYVPTRISDAANELTFDKAIPYGITVDKNKLVWVAGTDTTRRWVKAYQVTINFASPLYELPSQYDPVNPNTNGAPMRGPSDVALTKDALTAYVTDISAKVFRFKYTSAVDVADGQAQPGDFRLEQNYPNPFNPSTIISFTLAKTGNARLSVSNALGQEVKVLFEGTRYAGRNTEVFDAAGLPSGVYYYTLKTDVGTATQKMIYMK